MTSYFWSRLIVAFSDYRRRLLAVIYYYNTKSIGTGLFSFFNMKILFSCVKRGRIIHLSIVCLRNRVIPRSSCICGGGRGEWRVIVENVKVSLLMEKLII